MSINDCHDFDDELIEDLERNDLYRYVKVLGYLDKYIDLIHQNFEFSGDKIDWSKTQNNLHKDSNNKSLLQDAISFVSKLKQKYLVHNEQIVYIGDNLTEYGYQFELKNIEKLLPYFLEIPQHHYFIPLNAKWCICIAMEDYMDFGYSLNKNLK